MCRDAANDRATFRGMITLRLGDITTLAVDAIVNAANETFRGGGGVDGAIHRAAGPELLVECRRHPRLPSGTAVLTKGYRLPARYVIHTVGPIWTGGRAGEPAALERCYRSVFAVALAAGDIRSIAFPAISTGVYGVPTGVAAPIAIAVFREFESRFSEIIACVFDDGNFDEYRRALGTGLEAGGGT